MTEIRVEAYGDETPGLPLFAEATFLPTRQNTCVCTQYQSGTPTRLIVGSTRTEYGRKKRRKKKTCKPKRSALSSFFMLSFKPVV